MTRKNILARFFWAAVLLGLMLMPSVAAPPGSGDQAAGEIQVGPINPEFLRYWEEYQAGLLPQTTADGHFLGYVPSPADLSHLAGQALPGYREKASLPASFDLRSMGRLTPVRDQGLCGSCWTFATMASLESGLLPGETADFSENNLKNTNGFDRGPCNGGNAPMATAYLSRWSGPVAEAEDPYSPVSPDSPAGLTPRKHVQEAIFIPDRGSSSDNDNLKQAVMNSGAVFTSMYWEDAFFNSTYAAYYYSGANGSNHAIAIVGWDDNYDRNRFSTLPPGNGAFIIKNSWGELFGENGYCYVSYSDSRIGRENALFRNAEPLANYGGVYQYDPLGWDSKCGYGNPTAWGANIFTAAENATLAAVSFYTLSLNSSYEIYIYTNVSSTPTNGQMAVGPAGTIPETGYHTVTLTPPVAVTAGQKFSVVVKFTTPGNGWPIPTEANITGYTSGATANPGEGFISPSGTSWLDASTITSSNSSNYSVCIKAFTASAPCDIQISTQPQSKTISSGQTATLSVTATGTAPLAYQWYQGASANTANPISGATASGYTTPALTASASYWVRVSNSTGSIDSDTAAVTVQACTSPQVTTQPAGQTIVAGQIAVLWVAASGTVPFTYQWYLGSSPNTASPIGGATANFYPTPVLTATSGYWVKVTNACGSANSATATVTVNACSAPYISAHPAGKSVASGQTAALSVTASGTAPLSYQWYQGTCPSTASPVGGATGSTYTTPALTASRSYWAKVSNACGSAYSNTATVTVTTAAPAPPSRLVAGMVSASQIALSWADNSTDEVGFKIERKTGAGGSWSEITTIAANAVAFANTGLAAGTTYFYRVKSYNGSGNSAVSNTASACTGDYQLYIAAAAHNSTWRSDLDLFNNGAVDASIQVACLLMGHSNLAPVTTTVPVPAGKTVRLADILGGVPFTAGNAALGIRFLSGCVQANSRFYNIGSGHGSYGMGLEGVSETQALCGDGRCLGVFHHIAYSPVSNTGFRTNIGFANASGFSASVLIKLYGDNGELQATKTQSLQPYEHLQLTKIHEIMGITGTVNHGHATVEVQTAGAKVHVYAMLIDNLSADPVFWPVIVVPK